MKYNVIIKQVATNGSTNETLLTSFEAADDKAAAAYCNDPNHYRMFLSGGVYWLRSCVLRRSGEWSEASNIPFKR